MLTAEGLGAAARRAWLVVGLAANLGTLGYFKYANFLVDNLDRIAGVDWVIGEVLLPIGISFFTFQQIAYLVDACAGGAREYDLLHYGLFVTFFPQLIAGPIVHHGEMVPQFARNEGRGFDQKLFAGRADHLLRRAVQEGRASPTGWRIMPTPCSPPPSAACTCR